MIFLLIFSASADPIAIYQLSWRAVFSIKPTYLHAVYSAIILFVAIKAGATYLFPTFLLEGRGGRPQLSRDGNSSPVSTRHIASLAFGVWQAPFENLALLHPARRDAN